LLRSLLHLREAFHRLNSTRAAPWTQFPSPYQFVVHGMQADAPRFCVPVDASARCFVTFVPPTTIADVRTFLEAESSLHANSNDYPHEPVFAWNGFAAEPVACAHSGDALRRLVRDAANRNGIPDVLIGPSTGTSDLRHFISRGIPCLLYGPGRGFNPHRADEHFRLDDLPRMMKVYLDMAVGWCSQGRSPTA
jgi:acetylornithine deacetylase/succinyl-diaminopimelate desuccinylase-like protein